MKIAVMSDIHANIEAFDRVLGDIDSHGCTKILLLGDLVGYYYSSKEVVDKVRSDSRFVVIRGNHEDIFARTLIDVDFGQKMYLKYGSGYTSCRDTLSQDDIEWLNLLPVDKTLNIDGLKIGMFHGSDKSVGEYIYPDVSAERLDCLVEGFDFIFLGHTHYPVVFARGETTIVNPGSVGQPRDVGSLASYAILNTENKSIAFKRVPFSSSNLLHQCKKNDPQLPYLREIFFRNNPYAEN